MSTKSERWKTMADQFNGLLSIPASGWYCEYCGKILRKPKIVIALQHDNLYETGNDVENNNFMF